MTVPDEPVAQDSLTAAEFDTMMEAGLSQARADDSHSVSDVFSDLRKGLQK